MPAETVTEAPAQPVVETAPVTQQAPVQATAPVTDPQVDWKAEAEKWKAQARKNEDRSKANHEEVKDRDALLRGVADKLGIPFDGKLGPEQLTAKLEAAQRTARQKAIELAVYRSAAAAGADPDALLDSRSFTDRTVELDPDSADFTAQIASLISEVASSQPRYQAAAQTTAQTRPPTQTSGANFAAAPQVARQWTDADVAKASPAQLSKAAKDGLLVDLGVGVSKPGYSGR
jgi:hypothetical protein